VVVRSPLFRASEAGHGIATVPETPAVP
jgi:hypothetical protein